MVKLYSIICQTIIISYSTITPVFTYGDNIIYQTQLYCWEAEVFHAKMTLMLVTISHSHYLSIKNYK